VTSKPLQGIAVVTLHAEAHARAALGGASQTRVRWRERGEAEEEMSTHTLRSGLACGRRCCPMLVSIRGEGGRKEERERRPTSSPTAERWPS